VFLSRQLGIAFFRNPRTGSRAIRQLILPYCDIREVRHTRVTEETPFYKHIPPREARPHVERFGIDWNAIRKFTVVRNPFTRLVSYYHWRLLQVPPPREFKTHLLREVRSNNIMCGSIEYYAGDGTGKLAVDEVIRHEALEENLADLFARWNVPIDVEKLKIVGASPTYDLKEYYDDQSIDFVHRNYDFEFSQLGYSRELPV
jgi:hypothetical protein